MNLNNLQDYMNFYKSAIPAYPTYGPSMFGGGEDAMNAANYNGAALQFALRMAGQGQPSPNMKTPDFFASFSGNPPPGVTNGTNPYSQRVQDLQSNPYTQQSNYPALTNYLARLLK